MSLPSYNSGGVAGSNNTFWYSGTDTLAQGYNFTFDTSASPTDTDPKLRLGNVVIKPTTATLAFYAGVLAPQSVGKTGPCFIDLIVPEACKFVQVLCNANATLGTTGLSPQNGSYALAAHTDATLNMALVLQAAETADTSGTAAVKWARFVK